MTKNYSNSDLMKIAVREHLKCAEYPKVGVVVAKDGHIRPAWRGPDPLCAIVFGIRYNQPVIFTDYNVHRHTGGVISSFPR